MTSVSYDQEEAKELRARIRGKTQTLEERKRLTVELASLLLHEINRSMTSKEKGEQEMLARMMADPVGKAFTTAMTDESFRAHSKRRIANQILYLLRHFGLPRYLPLFKRMQLSLFRLLGSFGGQFAIPFVVRALRKETARVILPGEMKHLLHHILERNKEGVRLNINHLGEAILSEVEAKVRLHIYLEDLQHPEIDYVSIKISTLFSQINMIAFDESVLAIAKPLEQLYRAAQARRPCFINLDMEEYRDLHLTVAAFRSILDKPEFQDLSAGIVLQAYLPDSYVIQQELTEWAKKRVAQGGAPIKIRIVKGANLAMEQFEASLKGWPQAPYKTKLEVDANYKRMVLFGCKLENAKAAHLGIASHNLFDISFALLLRAENQVESYVNFEMLEGMADPMRRAVQAHAKGILLYCPVATKQEFQHAIAYLIRRLDENTGPENFLRHAFGLRPGTKAWDEQVEIFSKSCDLISTVSAKPRRAQNRQLHAPSPDPRAPFENEPDTDFALPQNQKWALQIIDTWKHKKIDPIPLVIAGYEISENQDGIGKNPSDPAHPLFRYTKANASHIDKALACAKSQERLWRETTAEHRSQLLAKVAQKLRERRGEFIGAMMVNGGKTLFESDPEVSEAIDFAEYYRRQIEKMASFKDLSWKSKGTILVIPPWNFPCAIPAGGILAALAAGNCVLFKPASDTVLIGWLLINAFWDAGIPKEVLQFVPCGGEESGKHLIQDPRLNAVILTGGTETALKLLKMRPGLDLSAETGGKNSVIITSLSDRDLAIKNLLQSAFGHSGQKCSAASLAILEKEVYDDPHFRRHLREAAASLKVGPAFDPKTKIGPLIRPPSGVLKRGLTTLDLGEEWLLEPKQDPQNPHLWSPGIKLGVRPGSFTHMTELFGPVLSLMRADSLSHALSIANAVPYGLTSGLESLDEREHHYWLRHIEAGNCYINRSTTGAIVRRQPFGGCKASNFGGGSKAGGPNYLREFMIPTQLSLPQEKEPVSDVVNSLTTYLAKLPLNTEQLGLFAGSTANYAYWWKKMRQDTDPSQIVGQDNFFRYVPRKQVALRIGASALPIDALRSIAAALTCHTPIEVSFAPSSPLPWGDLVPLIQAVEESDEEFQNRVRASKFERVRLLEKPTASLLDAAGETATFLIDAPVLANGRFELLHYLREVAISIDYHRYGNLGRREGEVRAPIL